jgi:hypothetical protein
MDLIGSVRHTDNRLGERKPDHGSGKPAPKNPRIEAMDNEEDQTDSPHSHIETDCRLGSKIDTTA